ncbi:MAG: hypothetical protein H8D63_02270 [Parcubacteria group bacterium]|nr:hypothetical protein [Parcubacteria group bacterium]
MHIFNNCITEHVVSFQKSKVWCSSGTVKKKKTKHKKDDIIFTVIPGLNGNLVDGHSKKGKDHTKN